MGCRISATILPILAKFHPVRANTITFSYSKTISRCFLHTVGLISTATNIFLSVEITNFCMLPFIGSPGDHRAFVIEATTRSLIVQNQLKFSRPAGRRLVMSQPQAASRYSQIVGEQFKIHRIKGANKCSRQSHNNMRKAGATMAQSHDNQSIQADG